MDLPKYVKVTTNWDAPEQPIPWERPLYLHRGEILNVAEWMTPPAGGMFSGKRRLKVYREGSSTWFYLPLVFAEPWTMPGFEWTKAEKEDEPQSASTSFFADQLRKRYEDQTLKWLYERNR